MALQATKSDEDAWEGGLQPARRFSAAHPSEAEASRGLRPALPSVFNRADCVHVPRVPTDLRARRSKRQRPARQIVSGTLKR